MTNRSRKSRKVPNPDLHHDIEQLRSGLSSTSLLLDKFMQSLRNVLVKEFAAQSDSPKITPDQFRETFDILADLQGQYVTVRVKLEAILTMVEIKS